MACTYSDEKNKTYNYKTVLKKCTKLKEELLTFNMPVSLSDVCIIKLWQPASHTI